MISAIITETLHKDLHDFVLISGVNRQIFIVAKNVSNKSCIKSRMYAFYFQYALFVSLTAFKTRTDEGFLCSSTL